MGTKSEACQLPLHPLSYFWGEMRSVCTAAALFPFPWVGGIIQQILFLSPAFSCVSGKSKSPENLYNCFLIRHVSCYTSVKSKSSSSHHGALQSPGRDKGSASAGGFISRQQQKHQHALGCIINGLCGLGIPCTWWMVLGLCVEACMCIVCVYPGWYPQEC